MAIADLCVGITELLQHSRELLHLGEDTGFVYADDLSRLNRQVHELIELLYPRKGRTVDEEASLCLAVLMGYAGSIYANPSDERKKRRILNRALAVLDKLPDSLLKCQLLTFCYGEVYEKELAEKAHEIIDAWERKEQTKLQEEIIGTLETLEKGNEIYERFI